MVPLTAGGPSVTVTDPDLESVSTFCTEYEPAAEPSVNRPSKSSLTDAFTCKSLVILLASAPVKVSVIVGCWLITKVLRREKALPGPNNSDTLYSEPFSL